MSNDRYSFDDEDALKEIGINAPRVWFYKVGESGFTSLYWVNVGETGETFIGTVEKTGLPPQIHIVYVPGRNFYTYFNVDSDEEAINLLWKEHLGELKIPQLKSPYKPLSLLPDDPDHYESLVKRIVNFLTE